MRTTTPTLNRIKIRDAHNPPTIRYHVRTLLACPMTSRNRLCLLRRQHLTKKLPNLFLNLFEGQFKKKKKNRKVIIFFKLSANSCPICSRSVKNLSQLVSWTSFWSSTQDHEKMPQAHATYQGQTHLTRKQWRASFNPKQSGLRTDISFLSQNMCSPKYPSLLPYYRETYQLWDIWCPFLINCYQPTANLQAGGLVSPFSHRSALISSHEGTKGEEQGLMANSEETENPWGAKPCQAERRQGRGYTTSCHGRQGPCRLPLPFWCWPPCVTLGTSRSLLVPWVPCSGAEKTILRILSILWNPQRRAEYPRTVLLVFLLHSLCSLF